MSIEIAKKDSIHEIKKELISLVENDLVKTIVGENLIEKIEDPIIRKFYQLVVDGVDPGIIQSMMVAEKNRLSFAMDFLIETVSSIQAGDNPRIVEEKVKCFLGDY